MGGVDNICSDKTGTLTENRMTVSNLYIGDEKKGGVDYPVMDDESLMNVGQDSTFS